MKKKDRLIKRVFDLFFSSFFIFLFFIFFIFLVIVSYFIDGKSGMFFQKRVGKDGKFFTIFKIKTIYNKSEPHKFGVFMRKWKLDELPQLVNVLLGDMSFVGPRPDISGFADKLVGKERVILTVKPGITGPATLLFRNEESLLKAQKEPVVYNKKVIWPQKISLNIKYVEEYSFRKDLYYIYKTLFF